MLRVVGDVKRNATAWATPISSLSSAARRRWSAVHPCPRTWCRRTLGVKFVESNPRRSRLRRTPRKSGVTRVKQLTVYRKLREKEKNRRANVNAPLQATVEISRRETISRLIGKEIIFYTSATFSSATRSWAIQLLKASVIRVKRNKLLLSLPSSGLIYV